MMRCDKTGLSDKDWKTILDVLNVYDPNDIAHVYPEMGSPEFVQDVTNAFDRVREHVVRLDAKAGPNAAPVDHMTLQYQQWIHES
jgi:hypothetical protein